MVLIANCNYRDESGKFSRSNRPDSMYGMSGQRRGQSTQSDDSSYGSYHGPAMSLTPPTRNPAIQQPVPDMIMPNYVQQNPRVGHVTQNERKLSGSGTPIPSTQNTTQMPNSLYSQKQQIQTNANTVAGPIQHQYNLHATRQN